MEQKQPEYLRISPLGLVPTLTLNGHSIVESASILRFIADKYQVNEYYPTNPQKRHAVDMLLDFYGNTLRPSFVKALRRLKFRVFNPALFGEKATTTERDELMKGAHGALSKFEDSLNDHHFATGD